MLLLLLLLCLHAATMRGGATGVTELSQSRLVPEAGIPSSAHSSDGRSEDKTIVRTQRAENYPEEDGTSSQFQDESRTQNLGTLFRYNDMLMKNMLLSSPPKQQNIARSRMLYGFLKPLDRRTVRHNSWDDHSVMHFGKRSVEEDDQEPINGTSDAINVDKKSLEHSVLHFGKKSDDNSWDDHNTMHFGKRSKSSWDDHNTMHFGKRMEDPWEDHNTMHFGKRMEDPWEDHNTMHFGKRMDNPWEDHNTMHFGKKTENSWQDHNTMHFGKRLTEQKKDYNTIHFDKKSSPQNSQTMMPVDKKSYPWDSQSMMHFGKKSVPWDSQSMMHFGKKSDPWDNQNMMHFGKKSDPWDSQNMMHFGKKSDSWDGQSMMHFGKKSDPWDGQSIMHFGKKSDPWDGQSMMHFGKKSDPWDSQSMMHFGKKSDPWDSQSMMHFGKKSDTWDGQSMMHFGKKSDPWDSQSMMHFGKKSDPWDSQNMMHFGKKSDPWDSQSMMHFGKKSDPWDSQSMMHFGKKSDPWDSQSMMHFGKKSDPWDSQNMMHFGKKSDPWDSQSMMHFGKKSNSWDIHTMMPNAKKSDVWEDHNTMHFGKRFENPWENHNTMHFGRKRSSYTPYGQKIDRLNESDKFKTSLHPNIENKPKANNKTVHKRSLTIKEFPVNGTMPLKSNAETVNKSNQIEILDNIKDISKIKLAMLSSNRVSKELMELLHSPHFSNKDTAQINSKASNHSAKIKKREVGEDWPNHLVMHFGKRYIGKSSKMLPLVFEGGLYPDNVVANGGAKINYKRDPWQEHSTMHFGKRYSDDSGRHSTMHFGKRYGDDAGIHSVMHFGKRSKTLPLALKSALNKLYTDDDKAKDNINYKRNPWQDHSTMHFGKRFETLESNVRPNEFNIADLKFPEELYDMINLEDASLDPVDDAVKDYDNMPRKTLAYILRETHKNDVRTNEDHNNDIEHTRHKRQIDDFYNHIVGNEQPEQYAFPQNIGIEKNDFESVDSSPFATTSAGIFGYSPNMRDPEDVLNHIVNERLEDATIQHAIDGRNLANVLALTKPSPLRPDNGDIGEQNNINPLSLDHQESKRSADPPEEAEYQLVVYPPPNLVSRDAPYKTLFKLKRQLPFGPQQKRYWGPFQGPKSIVYPHAWVAAQIRKSWAAPDYSRVPEARMAEKKEGPVNSFMHFGRR